MTGIHHRRIENDCNICLKTLEQQCANDGYTIRSSPQMPVAFTGLGGRFVERDAAGTGGA